MSGDARPDRFNCPFIIIADHLDDRDPRRSVNLEASIDRSDSVLDLARPSVRDAGQTVLNLVRLGEVRAEAQHELVIEVERKLRDASRALAEAQSRIEAQEDRLVAAEFPAQVAEVEARDAKEALALVEEAIRQRLLCTNPTAEAGKLEPVSQKPSVEPGLVSEDTPLWGKGNDAMTFTNSLQAAHGLPVGRTCREPSPAGETNCDNINWSWRGRGPERVLT